MDKIKNLFDHQERTYSFELFPPKTDAGYTKLLATVGELVKLKPDFISCTYGAGGGNRDKTFDIVQHIQEKHATIGLAHLTCILHSKEEIRSILEDLKFRKITNVLALRGDPSLDHPHWQPTDANFQYSSELCSFIRKHFGDYFSIAVAGFPEGHLLCKDRQLDAKFLKIKIDSGADFVITQLFFDNKDYFDYVERLRKLGVKNRVIPGILPVTDYKALLRFTASCGASVPEAVKEIFEPIQDNPENTLKAGIKFAVKQCKGLLKNGAPGLHFYTLNKLSPTDQILKEVLEEKS